MPEETIYKKIISLKNHTPSKEVDSAYTDLVHFCNFPIERPSSFFDKTKIKTIQNSCGKAERELELFWAKKIIRSKNPNKTLQLFPYYDNYKQLLTLELSTLQAVSKIKNPLFVGGGPLPLTSILLADMYSIKSTIIDLDEESVAIARELLSVLGLKEKINYKQGDAFFYTRYTNFDSIFLAALVGNTSREKMKIVDTVAHQMKKNSLLLCRSTFGIRTLLYSSLTKVRHPLLKLLFEIRPHNEIVNSFFILQKT